MCTQKVVRRKNGKREGKLSVGGAAMEKKKWEDEGTRVFRTMGSGKGRLAKAAFFVGLGASKYRVQIPLA